MCCVVYVVCVCGMCVLLCFVLCSTLNSFCCSRRLQSEEIINQVLDEIGINLSSQLADAPTQSTATAAPAKDTAADDLEARLANLRK